MSSSGKSKRTAATRGLTQVLPRESPGRMRSATASPQKPSLMHWKMLEDYAAFDRKS